MWCRTRGEEVLLTFVDRVVPVGYTIAPSAIALGQDLQAGFCMPGLQRIDFQCWADVEACKLLNTDQAAVEWVACYQGGRGLLPRLLSSLLSRSLSRLLSRLLSRM